jgi:ABC-type transporter Mla subunit MlaD
MAAWLALVKTALPYVANVVTTALPAFTARRAQEQASREEAAELTAQQISELQAAVTRNTESIRTLAEQVQKTMEAVEQGATSLEARMAQLDQSLARASHEADAFRQALNRCEQHNAKLEQQLRRMNRIVHAAAALAIIALAGALMALL